MDLTHSIAKSRLNAKSGFKNTFRGELVSQDPKDEPASELLKRIKEEQEKTGQKPKVKRARVKT
jgi:type I restriction enzyme S subunit